MKKLAAGAICEFIGGFALMFVGGAAILHGEGLLTVAIAHGLILGTTVTAFMHISGGQFNPAVSVALAIIRKQPWSRALVFIAAQLVGAVMAAWLLSAAFPSKALASGKLGATLGSLTSHDAEMSTVALALVLEIIATFFLMCVIMGSAVDERGAGRTATVGGLAIGLTLTADILAFGPLTGASMNPCRSFGPALVGGYWQWHWLYWVGPMIGAALAAILWVTLLGGTEEPGVVSPAERGIEGTA